MSRVKRNNVWNEENLDQKTRLWYSLNNNESYWLTILIESTTYKFAEANKREFGIIPEVTDHEYVTNSSKIEATLSSNR